MKRKIENPLEFYKQNNKFISDNLYKFQTYISIDCYVEKPTDKEYRIIGGAAIRAYLKEDDYKIGLTEISDFLAYGYSNKMFTLDEIQRANSHDIITAVVSQNFQTINKSAKESMSKNDIEDKEIDM